ncbi:MAG: hypothetical protein ACRCXC_06655 [Legionella sp.]
MYEFVCKLIDIQIQKYVALAKKGIGPDARLNATLVLEEVKELLSIAEQIITDIEKQQPVAQEQITSLFNQVRFYVEQEHLRALAGWLLDENNILSGVKERVDEQLKQLLQIGQSANIDCSEPAKPITTVQKQCAYDSHAIAFYILDLAKTLKENPEAELDSKIPMHARIVLKRNAKTRYCEEQFAQPIEELHQKCDSFLKHSELQKSTLLLSKEVAQQEEQEHKEQWQSVFDRYRHIEHTSELFSSKYEWYKVALAPVEKQQSISSKSSSNITFFSGVVLIGAVAIYMLMSYFRQLEEQNSLKSTFGM